MVLKAAGCFVLKNRVFSSRFQKIYHRNEREYKQIEVF